MPLPAAAALALKWAPFVIGALQSWRGGRRQNQAARRAYDDKYGNNPRWHMRNAYLTQL